jgi:quinol monooxygenase YgiN
MIFIVVRHPIRAESAEEFPRLMEGFTAATRAEAGWSAMAELRPVPG